MKPAGLMGFSLLCLSLLAGDWQQWRGSQRDGVVSAWQLPREIKQPKQVWSVSAGEGHAGPVIAGDRVFLHTREGEREIVTAYSPADGKQLWKQDYPAPFHMNGYATSHGKGPKATPLVSSRFLVTFGISGIISVFATDTGKLLWQKTHFPPAKTSDGYVCPPCGRDCDKQVYDKPGKCPSEGCNIFLTARGSDTAGLFCGASSSPLLLEDRIILHSGNDKRGAVAAYSLSSGDLVWERKGPGPGYASPVLMTFGGVNHLVTLTRNSVIGLNPHNGKTLWEHPFPDPYNENIITPVQHGDSIIVSGTNQPMQALKVSRKEGTWTIGQTWSNDQVFLYMSSPVLWNDRLYGLNKKKKGSFFCADPQTGKLVWSTEGRKGFNASLIASDNKILTLSTDGQLRIYAAGDTEKLLGDFEVSNSPIWAHLTPYRNGFFVKNKDSLAFWSF